MIRTMQRARRGWRRGAAPAPAAILCALSFLPMLTGCGTLWSGGRAPPASASGNGNARPQPIDAAVLIPKCQTIVHDTYAGQPVTYGPPSATVNGDAASVTVPFMLPRPDGSYGDSYAKYTCRFTGSALTGSGLTP